MRALTVSFRILDEAEDDDDDDDEARPFSAPRLA